MEGETKHRESPSPRLSLSIKYEKPSAGAAFTCILQKIAGKLKVSCSYFRDILAIGFSSEPR